MGKSSQLKFSGNQVAPNDVKRFNVYLFERARDLWRLYF